MITYQTYYLSLPQKVSFMKAETFVCFIYYYIAFN